MRYTRREAARIADVSKDTLARHIRLGHLPEPSRGNSRRKWYDEADLAVIVKFFARPRVRAGHPQEVTRPAGWEVPAGR